MRQQLTRHDTAWLASLLIFFAGVNDPDPVHVAAFISFAVIGIIVVAIFVMMDDVGGDE